jgi:hypothetical protein
VVAEELPGDLGDLSPPVLLKGPQKIPLPAVLRQHGGRFLITLRCDIDVDGSSQVSVMDSTGMLELDEALRQSFSNLPWYPGENSRGTVKIAVRLIIEANWQTSEDVIHWKGRIPKP